MHSMDNAIDVEDLNEFVLHEILPAKQNAFQKRKLSIFPLCFFTDNSRSCTEAQQARILKSLHYFGLCFYRSMTI